ncbi:sulfatase family protein [Draconibacterium sediminis]|uniref:sulfatase family protein n=1 Tax=Draconibacterium sediminis TaxID=1544798 RepID=UPI000AC74DA3|nr:sulfatase [Draconibacterium sediminis]
MKIAINNMLERYIVAIAVLLGVIGIVSTNAHAQQKPNILWLTIEDTSPQFVGCYGNKDARTPVIDKLAEEGVRFTNAFSTGTVCSPSRSAIITGVHTFKMGTGHHRSNYQIPDFIKGFPYFLQQQGYYVSNSYKTDYNVANMKQFTAEAWNESSGKAGWWNRKPGQPFFAVFNFNDSHQSRTMSNSYEWYEKYVLSNLSQEEKISEDAFEMPPFYKDSPEMRKDFARVYNSIKLTDKRIGELLDKLDKDNLRDSTIIFFYADHGEGIPRAKTNGINLGYRVPFVIWFPEMYKHLSPWGTAGVVTDELIDFKDLAPTLVSLTGGEVPEYMTGRVLLGENRSPEADHLILSTDRADNGPDLVRTITNGRFVYSRNFMPYMPQMRYIRYLEIADITKEMRSDLKKGNLDEFQKSLFDERPAEYLFDIESDMWERRNLVNDPEYKSVLKKMRKQLDDEILLAKDAHFMPEYELGLISETGNAYEFRLDKSNYPFEKIYAAASLSGKRGDETIRRQNSLLKNENKFIRYWAIVGLRSQKKESLLKYKKEIISAMDDPYLPVAVMASSIAYQCFDSKAAEQKLVSFAKHDNMDIALLAINEMLYFDNKEPFVETIENVYKLPERNFNVKGACLDFLGILGKVPNTPDYGS